MAVSKLPKMQTGGYKADPLQMDHCARNLFFIYLEIILHLATEVVPDTDPPPPPKLVSPVTNFVVNKDPRTGKIWPPFETFGPTLPPPK